MQEEIGKVFQNKGYSEVVFEYGQLTSNRIIFAGLYPPGHAKSQLQHLNRTSKEVIKNLGIDNFDWIDLFPYSPKNKSGDFDEPSLRTLLKHNKNFGKLWIEKIQSRIEEVKRANYDPIVFICGELCKYYWDKNNWNVSKNENSDIIQKLFPNYLFARTSSNIKFELVYGQHPSAHLVGCGNLQAREIFDQNMRLLFDLYFNKTPIIGEMKEHRFKICNEIGMYLFQNSSWSKEMNHMFAMPFEDEEYCERVKYLKDVNCESLLENKIFACYLRYDKFHELFLQDLLYARKLFMSKGYCLNLQNENFRMKCTLIKEILTSKLQEHLFYILINKISFCNSVTLFGFVEQFEKLSKQHKIEDVVKMFSLSEFCFQITYSEFQERLEEVKIVMNGEIGGLYSNTSFITNIMDSRFFVLFEKQLSTFHIPNTLKLYSQPSFCNNIQNPEFEKELTFAVKSIGIDQTVKLFSDSAFNKRSIEPLFLKRFYSLRKSMGDEQAQKLYRCSAFCVRILETDFLEKFEFLSHSLGCEQAQKLYQGSAFCVRIVESDFLDKFQSLSMSLGRHNAERLYQCSAFCVRILEPDFLNQLYSVQQVLGVKNTQKLFASSAFCVRVQDSEFLQKLYDIVKILENYASKLFSCDSMFVRINNPEFIQTFFDFINMVGKHRTSKLFSNEMFCTHLLQPGFLSIFKESVEEIGLISSITLFKNSYCKLVQNPQIHNIIDELRRNFTPEQILRMLKNGVFCTSILREDFRQIIENVLTELKKSRTSPQEDCTFLFSKAFTSLFQNAGMHLRLNTKKCKEKCTCKECKFDVFWQKFVEFLNDSNWSQLIMRLFSYHDFCNFFKDNELIETTNMLNHVKEHLGDNFEIACRNEKMVQYFNNDAFLKIWSSNIIKSFPMFSRILAASPSFVCRLLPVTEDSKTSKRKRNESIVDYSFLKEFHSDMEFPEIGMKLYKSDGYVKHGHNIRVNPFFKNWVLNIGCDESHLFESSSFCSNFNNDFQTEMTFWKDKVGPNLVAKLFQCNAFCSRVVKDALLIQKLFDETMNKYDLRIATGLFSVNSFITNIDPTKMDQHILDKQVVAKDKTSQGVALLYELLDVFELFSGIYDQPTTLQLFHSAVRVAELEIQLTNTQVYNGALSVIGGSVSTNLTQENRGLVKVNNALKKV
jgi:hypothetical protein